ncbi:hypothetical protein HDV05_008694, partial [Chytridiales sp. JEL 0842]
EMGLCVIEWGTWAKLCERLAAEGRFEDIQTVVEARGRSCITKSTVSEAAATGNMELVKHLADIAGGCGRFGMRHAAEFGYFDIVRFLYELPQMRFDLGCVLVSAAVGGHLNIVKYVHGLESVPHDHDGIDEAMYQAAANGHLNVVKFLYEYHQKGSFPGMVTACKNGHLSVVKYYANVVLYEPEGSMINYAAEAGHLRTVKFIHRQLSTAASRTSKALFHVIRVRPPSAENCTTDAVDFAVKNGHIDVVKFLLCNREEGYSKKALDFAMALSKTNACLSAALLSLLHQHSHLLGESTAFCLCNRYYGILDTIKVQCNYEFDSVCARPHYSNV